MKRTLMAVLVAFAGFARADVLEDCVRGARDRGEVTACLHEARRVATDAMLGAFLGVEKAMSGIDEARERPGAVAVLRESQREFERYVSAHCRLVLAAALGQRDPGQAALACEVEMLRQRAALLESLAPRPN
jgi:uncharacterized protein YecT (DUF1311 family)